MKIAVDAALRRSAANRGNGFVDIENVDQPPQLHARPQAKRDARDDAEQPVSADD